MNNYLPMQNRNTEQHIDAYGKRLTAWLDPASNDIPAHVMERLRASRMQAVARRRMLKIETASSVFANQTTATLGGGAPFGFGAGLQACSPWSLCSLASWGLACSKKSSVPKNWRR